MLTTFWIPLFSDDFSSEVVSARVLRWSSQVPVPMLEILHSGLTL